MKTYYEILEAMKETFYENLGESVKAQSDLEARLKAVASEIFSLSCYGDYIIKQAFPQSATGEHLENHAALRGITRKAAAQATGVLLFSIDEALDEEVEIPAGTVCSCADSVYIQFSTDCDVTIAPGETTAAAAATALGTGEAYNVPAGAVTVMVNPPESVGAVTNEAAFTGGADDETDSSLRERILSSYSARNNCINEKSVRELLLSVEEITDALPRLGDGGEVNLYLKTKSGEISESLQAEVGDLLGFASICGIEINCIAATPKRFDLTALVRVLSGYDESEVLAAVENAIRSFCADGKIGKSLSASMLASAACRCCGVGWADIVPQHSAAGTMCCGVGEYLALGEVEVAADES